jgi:hypothetical protein
MVATRSQPYRNIISSHENDAEAVAPPRRLGRAESYRLPGRMAAAAFIQADAEQRGGEGEARRERQDKHAIVRHRHRDDQDPACQHAGAADGKGRAGRVLEIRQPPQQPSAYGAGPYPMADSRADAAQLAGCAHGINRRADWEVLSRWCNLWRGRRASRAHGFQRAISRVPRNTPKTANSIPLTYM